MRSARVLRGVDPGSGHFRRRYPFRRDALRPHTRDTPRGTQSEPAGSRVALLRHRPDDLRNHFAGTLEEHNVADAQILMRDQFEIVERRIPDGGAADFNRLEHGIGIDLAGSAHVDLDGEQSRFGDVWRKLSRNRPARNTAADHTQLALQRQRIHLHDQAVDAKVERGACGRLHLMCVGMHVRERRAPLAMRGNGDAPRDQRVEQFPLRPERERCAARDRKGVAEKAQRARRRDRRVLLSERARRTVPRVRKHGLSSLCALLIELLKAVERKVHFAANLNHRGMPRAVKPERNPTNSAEVRRNVLAHRTVATRRARHKHAVAIREAHRRTINLELRAVPVSRDRLAHDLHRARVPVHDFVVTKRIVERDHRDQMRMLRKTGGGLRPNAHRRRVQRPQLRMLTLNCLQLAEQHIIVAVRQRRPIEHVVVVRCPFQHLTQLGGSRGGWRHSFRHSLRTRSAARR